MKPLHFPSVYFALRPEALGGLVEGPIPRIPGASIKRGVVRCPYNAADIMLRLLGDGVVAQSWSDSEQFFPAIAPSIEAILSPELNDRARRFLASTPYQMEGFLFAYRKVNSHTHISPGGGKCLGRGTPILLYDGRIISIECVQPGDVLMGPDSTPRRVLTTTQGRGPLYRVVPLRGTPWICNDAHQLTLVHSGKNHVIDISARSWLGMRREDRVRYKLFSVAVVFPAGPPLPVDPYLLGVWFGDGSKTVARQGLVGVCITKPDTEIEALMHQTATHYNLRVRKFYSSSRCPTFALVGAKHRQNPLLNAIRDLCGPELAVPPTYLTASWKDRAAFLAGWLDTDGYRHRSGYEIVQKRSDYADAVAFLARSLGLRCTRSLKHVKGYGVYHRLSISGDCTFLPLRIPRKRPVLRRQIKNATRTGFHLEPLGVGDYFGFTLDGDGRFLLGDFTVTHNTLISIANALAEKGPIAYVTRAGARRHIAREFRKYSSIEPIVLEGIDVKALDSQQRAYIIGWENLPAWAKALADIKPTTLVLDESHRGKQHKRWRAIPLPNGRVRFASLENVSAAASLLSRASHRRHATTGTAVKDRIRDLWGQLDLVEPGAWGTYRQFTFQHCAGHEGPWGWDAKGSSNLQELQERMAHVVYAVPYSITHRDLPPARLEVVRLPPEQQNAPSGGWDKEIKDAQKDPHRKFEVALMVAASRKRGYIVGRVEEATADKQKVVVFTGRRQDTERLGEAIRKKCPADTAVWVGHGGVPEKERDRMVTSYMEHPGPAVLVGTGYVWGECVPPDTFLLGGDEGGVPIGERIPGERVLGATGLGRVTKKWIKQFKGEMVKLRGTGLLPLRATPNHPILVRSVTRTRGRNRRLIFGAPCWKRAENVCVWNPSSKRPQHASGDYLLIPRLRGTCHATSFDLERFCKDAGRVRARRTRGLPTRFPLNEATAWVMGLFVAEGSTSKNVAAYKPTTARQRALRRTCQNRPGISWRTTFGLGAHEAATATRVRRVLAAVGFKSTERFLRVSNGLLLEVKSTPLSLLFRKLFGAGSENKRIPSSILLHRDTRILRAFLAGYVEGDGSVADHTVRTATVSRTLALQIQLLVARLGYLGTLTVKTNNGGTIRGRAVVNQLPIYTVCWRTKTKGHVRHRVFPDHIAVPVRSAAREYYDGPVVDIETTDHTFLASNAIIHNSIDLQDTNLALMCMLPWTPGDVTQWTLRFCRKGQTRRVLIQFVVAERTADEHVAEILLDKLPDVVTISKDERIEGLAVELEGVKGHEEELLAGVADKLAKDPREMWE